jgi:hypothetical protein
MKNCLMAMCFSALTVSMALAQQKNAVSLPPNAAAEGSGLEVTMNFTPDNLNVVDNATRPDSTSGEIKQEVTVVSVDPRSADNNLPRTLTVRTAALLELHAMRQSAVSLCLQLPAKYRTHLPECADIFQHEIRLERLAKHK